MNPEGPPLVLHAFYTGDSRVLSAWAQTIRPPSEAATYFNFLDSHDGIGLLGVRNILSPEDVALICRRAQDHGGLISYQISGDGAMIPYEFNLPWYSALNRKNDGDTLTIQIRRFIASRAIALVLRGVPGIYLHSLFGTHNAHEVAESTRKAKSSASTGASGK